MTARTPDNLFRDFLRSGDPEAFASLYDHARPELLGIAGRLAPNVSCAEDLVQATFLGALESAGRFKRGHKVMAWLVGILKNQAKLMRWRESRKPEAERLAWPEVADPVSQAEGRELQSTLAKALGKLGAIYEPIMRSHLRDELTAQEIAVQINRPAGTVRTQIVRGTAMLRSLLPAGIATMLFVRLTPGLIAADVRTELAMRAGNGVVQRSWWMTTTLRTALLAIGAAVGIAIGTLVAIDAFRSDVTPLSGTPAAANVLTELPIVAQPSSQANASTANRALTMLDNRTALEVTVTGPTAVAPGVPVHVLAFNDLRFSRHLATTAADGVARFEGLVAGKYLVLPHATGTPRQNAMLELTPNTTTKHSVRVTEMATIRGRVVDQGGFAVANATVWLSDGTAQHGGLAAMPFTSSDATGHFQIVRFPKSRLTHVQATGRGHAASSLQVIPRTADAPLTVALHPNGGNVSGTVVDESGQPCADLMVRATVHGTRSRLEGSTDFGTVREVRTDADGTFAINGFSTSTAVRINAWGPTYARYEQIVAVGSNTQVTMNRGATIRGRILADGTEPGVVEIHTEVDARDDRLQCSIYSNEQGEFEFTGLTPGKRLTVTAESPQPPIGPGLGKVVTTVVLQPGKTHEWNPTLTAGDLMAGTLRSSDGTPLTDWRIDISAVNVHEGRSYFTVKTDVKGRFSMRGLPRSNYTFAPRTRSGANAVKFVATWPLQTDYELVIDADRVAWVTNPEHDRFAPNPTAKPATLPVGTLNIEGIQPADRIWLMVYRADGSNAGAHPKWDKQRAVHTAEMQPGRYQLSVGSNAWSTSKLTTSDHLIDFTIASGSPTTLATEMQPGVRRNFRIVEPSHHLGADGGTATITDATGNVVARADVVRWLNTTPTKFEATIALAPGNYRMKVTTSIGHVGSIDFAIFDLTPNEMVLDLKVK